MTRTVHIELVAGEGITLSGQGDVRVILSHKSGRRARLRIEGDDTVAIGRLCDHEVSPAEKLLE